MFDVPMSRKVHAHCDGVARRDFLRLGALAPLGFSLGNFLSARSAGARSRPGSSAAKCALSLPAPAWSWASTLATSIASCSSILPATWCACCNASAEADTVRDGCGAAWC